jgi:integrase
MVMKSKNGTLRGPVFRTPLGNELQVRYLVREFCEARDRTGIPDFRFHDMRHTFATRLVQRGVDLYKVQRLLGHKTSLMTQRYAHHSPESLREGVNVLDEPQAQRVSTNLAQGPILNGLARASTLASD